MRPAQSSEQLESVFVAELDVEDETEIRCRLFRQVVTVLRRHHLIPGETQHPGKCFSKTGIVFDEQQWRVGRHCGGL